MTQNTKASERMKRCRVEWMRFLKPLEYVLLDRMLFQANLTHANEGQGFLFHVRKLAEQTGISQGMVSQIIGQWPFIKKQGKTKAMVIKLDYPAFESWIAHQTNNHCSPGEPRSSSEDSTVPGRIAHQVDDKKSTENAPSEARVEPQAIPVVNGAKPLPTAGRSGIVHQVNDNKSPRYIASDKEPLPLSMPKSIKPGPSAARQGEIVRQLNAGGFSFVKDTAMGTERHGFKFTAIDDTDRIVLITADDKAFLNNPKTQALCRHFRREKYKVMLWTEKHQAIFNVVKETQSEAEAPTKPNPSETERNSTNQ